MVKTRVDWMNIDFGQGIYKKDGWTTVDIDTKYQPDKLHDMNIYPYPFEDNCADVIKCSHVLEHLKNPVRSILEFHRILKPNGLLILEFPHHSRNWAGCGVFPHSHICSIPVDIMNFFVSEFDVKKIRLEWLRSPAGKMKLHNSILNNIVSYFASHNIKVADRVWCYWVGGFDNVRIEATKRQISIHNDEQERLRKEYHFQELI